MIEGGQLPTVRPQLCLLYCPLRLLDMGVKQPRNEYLEIYRAYKTAEERKRLEESLDRNREYLSSSRYQLEVTRRDIALYEARILRLEMEIQEEEHKLMSL